MKKDFKTNVIDVAIREFTEAEMPNGKYYTIVPQALHFCPFLDANELRIILALSAFADGKGKDRTNQSRLKKRANISSPTTLRDKLISLEEKYFIEINSSENKNGGVPLTYTLKDLHSNPYILLSEAMEEVEGLAKEYYNVSTDNIVKKLNKIVRNENVYSSMVAEIPHSIEGYQVALEKVAEHIKNEFEEERAQKEEKISNVVRFKKKVAEYKKKKAQCKKTTRRKKTTYTGSKSQSL